jgi:hypothetical protein
MNFKKKALAALVMLGTLYPISAMDNTEPDESGSDWKQVLYSAVAQAKEHRGIAAVSTVAVGGGLLYGYNNKFRTISKNIGSKVKNTVSTAWTDIKNNGLSTSFVAKAIGGTAIVVGGYVGVQALRNNSNVQETVTATQALIKKHGSQFVKNLKEDRKTQLAVGLGAIGAISLLNWAYKSYIKKDEEKVVVRHEERIVRKQVPKEDTPVRDCVTRQEGVQEWKTVWQALVDSFTTKQRGFPSLEYLLYNAFFDKPLVLTEDQDFMSMLDDNQKKLVEKMVASYLEQQLLKT